MNTHIGIQIGWRRKKINELERRKTMINVQIQNLYEQIKNLEKVYQQQKQKVN
jgi:prefoldin subunit 5